MLRNFQIAPYSLENLNEIKNGNFSNPSIFYYGIGNTEWIEQSGNDNNGTVHGTTESASISLTAESITWETQSYFHYNLENGFRQEAFKIPAGQKSLTAVNGKPLTNLAWDNVTINGAESYWQSIDE